jgi:hypothetical protein
MRMRIVFKIICLATALVLATEAGARAQTPPAQTPPAVAPAAPPPPDTNLVAPPAPPVPGPPADRAAPDTGGPALELPAERDMPQMTLPRETAIENPLRAISAASATAIGGYGELTLNTPSNNLVPPHNGPAVVDLRRLVLFVGHNFSDRIRFYSELEVEHAVSSSTDQGEFEVEQAYLDGLFNRHFNLRGGLIIMPVGIINVYHEPPTFNGVDRPDVDTLVIPSTWREAGFGVFGEITTGLSYQVYAVTSFNANGFTAESGIAEGHQEAQLAYAGDGGLVARLTYEPLLATIFGVSGYAATSGNDLRATVGRVPLGLVEADARTRYHGFTARAELAFLFIGDTEALNQQFVTNGTADQMANAMIGPVAKQLRGAYVEAGYNLLRLAAPSSDQDLTLFFRYDYANTQASVAPGFTANPELIRTTQTVGLVYRPIPEIGLKSDYQRHEFGAGASYNEYAAAITWMF